MNNNTIKFLDIMFIKINNSLQFIMQIKALKLEFFVPFNSNHPNLMKINIVKNMVRRAVILCSNKLLFFHTFIALRLRFQKSGYPDTFLLRHMNLDEYNNRESYITKLNQNRIDKIKSILKQEKIKYTPSWIPSDEKRYIPILFDKTLSNSQYNLKKYLKYKHPQKRIIYKLNNSIQKIIRSKDANYDT